MPDIIDIRPQLIHPYASRAVQQALEELGPDASPEDVEERAVQLMDELVPDHVQHGPKKAPFSIDWATRKVTFNG